MTITKEIYNFDELELSSGAEDTLSYLSEDEKETVFSLMEETFNGEADETDIDDFLDYDNDTIAEWIGFPDFDTLCEARKDEWYDTYDEYLKAKENEEEEEA